MMTYQKLMCDGFELNYCIKGQGQPILVVGVVFIIHVCSQKTFTNISR